MFILEVETRNNLDFMIVIKIMLTIGEVYG
jgi:hypothetical protein